MGPLILGAAGVLALLVAAAILRSFGPRYRVGRLLAVVPQIPVADAIRIAASGERRYVRVDGRIDSEEEFEDEHHRPLVLRRRTFEWRPPGGRWRRVGPPELELVPFVVREGLDELDVDARGLAEGLVVVPRIGTGTVADLGDRAPAGAPPEAPGRMVVEQVSSVEHATILGVPARGPDGRTTMVAGLGRPLILTTLERDEAMRVLTGGAADRSRIALACLAAGAVLLVLAVAWWLLEAVLGGGVATAVAASPAPTFEQGTDIRAGETAGFLGEPLLAVLGVLGVALVSVLATLAWVRLTGGRRAAAPRDPGTSR